MGRPTKYQDLHTCVAVEAMASMGLTDKQMAKKLDMTEQSFNNWKTVHPEFFESLKKGKDKADDRVEKSLYKNAIGYTYHAKKPMVVSDGSGCGSHAEIIEYTERSLPQTVAQIFWLKNRRPDRWREKQELEMSGGLKGLVDDSAAKREEEYKKIVAELAKKPK